MKKYLNVTIQSPTYRCRKWMASEVICRPKRSDNPVAVINGEGKTLQECLRNLEKNRRVMGYDR